MRKLRSNYPRDLNSEPKGPRAEPMRLGWKSTGWAVLGVGVLFVLGFGSIVAGDMGSDPVYHGGGLLMLSIPFLIVIWFIALGGLAQVKLRRLAVLPLLFLAWSIGGYGILCGVEVWSGGTCCTNQVLRSQISFFSITWPSIFVCIASVICIHGVRSKISLTARTTLSGNNPDHRDAFRTDAIGDRDDSSVS